MVYVAYFGIFALAYLIMVYPDVASRLRRYKQTYRH